MSPKIELAESAIAFYASYPKTGSTALPNILDRWLRGAGKDRGEIVEWGGGKHNFRIGAPPDGRLLIKTHHTIGDFARKLRKQPDSLARLADALDRGSVDLFSGRGCAYIYMLRNPFCVLNSAIDYSRMLYQRPEAASAWVEDGRAQRFFVDLLGLPSIPDGALFSQFAFLELPARQIEDIVWRFIETSGSIPIFEAGDMLTYFQHVNYYQNALAGVGDAPQVLLNYEQLMADPEPALSAVAALLGISPAELLESWLTEGAAREGGRGRYKSGFYGGFHERTPSAIRELGSWERMLSYVDAACPALRSLVN